MAATSSRRFATHEQHVARPGRKSNNRKAQEAQEAARQRAEALRVQLIDVAVRFNTLQSVADFEFFPPLRCETPLAGLEAAMACLQKQPVDACRRSSTSWKRGVTLQLLQRATLRGTLNVWLSSTATRDLELAVYLYARLIDGLSMSEAGNRYLGLSDRNNVADNYHKPAFSQLWAFQWETLKYADWVCSSGSMRRAVDRFWHPDQPDEQAQALAQLFAAALQRLTPLVERRRTRRRGYQPDAQEGCAAGGAVAVVVPDHQVQYHLS